MLEELVYGEVPRPKNSAKTKLALKEYTATTTRIIQHTAFTQLQLFSMQVILSAASDVLSRKTISCCTS